MANIEFNDAPALAELQAAAQSPIGQKMMGFGAVGATFTAAGGSKFFGTLAQQLGRNTLKKVAGVAIALSLVRPVGDFISGLLTDKEASADVEVNFFKKGIIDLNTLDEHLKALDLDPEFRKAKIAEALISAGEPFMSETSPEDISRQFSQGFIDRTQLSLDAQIAQQGDDQGPIGTFDQGLVAGPSVAPGTPGGPLLKRRKNPATGRVQEDIQATQGGVNRPLSLPPAAASSINQATTRAPEPQAGGFSTAPISQQSSATGGFSSIPQQPIPATMMTPAQIQEILRRFGRV